ncbi:MAG: sensor histidine kinase [Ramlibacter sp.]
MKNQAGQPAMGTAAASLPEPAAGVGGVASVLAVVAFVLTASAVKVSYEAIQEPGAADMLWLSAAGTIALFVCALWIALRERTASQIRLLDAARLEQLVHLRTRELEQANRALVLAWAGLEARNVALQAAVEQHSRTEGALQRAMAEMESFSYTVSHDLRAPLAAVQSFAGALLESEASALSEPGRHRLDRIVVGAQRMNRMIDDILACSRVERAEMRCRVVDLNSLVADVVAEAGPMWPRAAVAVEPLPAVGGDANMLRQIFANLIGNALKFSAGRADARVEVAARRTDCGTEISVRDNGAGFDPAYAGKLFGLFQRLHSEAEFTGTGVGLAIVKRLVHRHGGEVRAESVPGGWTTFSFTLGDVCALEGCEGQARSTDCV